MASLARPQPRTVDAALIDDIAAAWAIALSDLQRKELSNFLNRAVPATAVRSHSQRRGAPPKDNLRRFVVEFGLHFESAGGHVSGSWRRGSTTITGPFAKGLRVVWAALPIGVRSYTSQETFARYTKSYPRGWRSHGCAARADYQLRLLNGWRD